MRAPDFWQHDGALAYLLAPLAGAYQLAGALRRRTARPWRAPRPVICVGNLVAGGAGKTPVVLSLLGLLTERGLKPAALTRGYGGSAAGPLRVDPAQHDAATVGDEALLLARAAPTWVARDRVAGAKAALAAGAEVIVMDDGFQNPRLAKDLSLLVIDAAYGLGNGRVMPAGPLRETAASGLARADALIVLGGGGSKGEAYIGETEKNLAGPLPVLRAQLTPVDTALSGQRVFAFAGIGRPEKFFQTLRDLGAEVVGSEAFADHQPYTRATLERLRLAAAAAEARLVTTAKDAARLSPARDIAVLDVTLTWADKDALLRLLERLPPASVTAAAR